MTLLEAYIHAPLARAIGWSLVHFLWEGALIAAILALLLFLCGPNAHLRYVLACLALLAMPLAFAITLARVEPAPQTVVTRSLHLAPAPDPNPAARHAPTPLPWTVRLREALPWTVPIWAAGVLLFALRSLAGWIAAQRLRRSGVCAASAEWRDRLRTLCELLHLSPTVELLESCRIDVPVVVGFLRPVILMPVGLLIGLPTDQLESILIHELAHIRRRDYLVNLLQTAAECLLFYHPAVWWVSGIIRAERENCCDDLVVAVHGDPRRYAAALATLETIRWAAHEPALAATGGNLMKRIHRLIQQPERPRTAAAPLFAAGLLVVTLGVALGDWQIKPSAPTAPPPTPAVAQIAQAQVPAPPLRKQGVTKQTPAEPMTPYKKWLNEDVAYIITDEERAAFKQLPTDPEREHFIEQFWLRRDPTPNTPENEFKEEHYRRIAYANEHYASQIPGWKTDRGRIYISYGPPDEIESHPSGGQYQRPAAEGGGSTNTFPFEQWRYRFIDGVGKNIIVEFVDPTYTGEYRMTMDPNEKDALRFVKPPANADVARAEAQLLGRAGAKTGSFVEVNGRLVQVTVPVNRYNGHAIEIVGRVIAPDGRPVYNFQDSFAGAGNYQKSFGIPTGSYRLVIAVKDTVTAATNVDNLNFEMK